MMTRRIVVTGGCGYIGSHVARAFKQNGDNVIVIDRVKRDHTLKDLDGHYISDFASDDALATIYDYQPDVIVHCAGTSLVGPSMSDPGEYYDNNISKTIKLLNFVKDFDKKPLIMFSSSASVYGEPECLPIKEYDDIKPISPYGNTKAMTETILKDYWGAYALPSMCFRYFNAAGASMAVAGTSSSGSSSATGLPLQGWRWRSGCALTAGSHASPPHPAGCPGGPGGRCRTRHSCACRRSG
jgi:UDP-glucose 4-epimerase